MNATPDYLIGAFNVFEQITGPPVRDLLQQLSAAEARQPLPQGWGYVHSSTCERSPNGDWLITVKATPTRFTTFEED